MKVLFFTSSSQDYLADSVLHGMRTILGNDCIDYPKCEVLYKNYKNTHNDIYGRGFTLYTGLLDDIEIDRINIDHKIKSNYFDLIVLGNIQRQFGWFLQYRPWLNRKNSIIIDGEDTPHPYPARGFWWRKPYYWFLPKAHKDFLYFKREWTSETHFRLWMRLFPLKTRQYLSQSKNLRQISFSIPYEKIVKVLPIKTKLFPKHIVDEEVANLVEGSSTKYAFENEKDYYADLQTSKFGVTTKRSGWDCMRHYEIAANGAVICFKELDKKENTCAPHGLNTKNSIFYTNAKDLFDKVNNLTELEYQKLQEASILWAIQHTTDNVAKYILKLINI
jgi:hypothetical protein